jgi:iron complex outermembrane receptor protein
MKTILLLPILSISLTLTTNVWAQELDIDELDSVIVQDTLDINPNASEPESYNRISPTSSDGGDFLTQINGISMSRFGGRGLEPIIRGQTQTQLNILLDGAYIHGGCPNRMDPPASWAALETYENVTVLKGVQSLVYGGGGSGGTVLFERDTRDLAQEKGLHGRISLMGSDNAIQHDVLADVVAAGEKGYVRGIGEIKKAQNYEDGDGREVRSAYDHKQVGIIAGFTPTEDRLFEFSVEHNAFSDALYPGAGMDSPREDGDIYRLRYLDKPASDKIDGIKAEIYLSDVDHLMDNFSLRPNMGMKMATPTTSKTRGGRVVLQSTLGKTKIEYGIDIQNNDRNAVLNNVTANKSVSIMWPDIAIDQTGLFAEATTSLQNQQRLKYGVRVDRVNVSSSKANVAADISGRNANQSYQFYYGTNANDRDETNVGGLLRYEKDFGHGLSLFSGLSRSVRTADATERGINKWVAGATSRWVGNPAIKPEKHHQFDIGVGKKTEKLDISAVAFIDRVDDYILRDTARGQAGILQTDGAEIYRNVDATLKGLELEGRFKLSERLDLTGSLAYVHATNTTDDRPIAQTPPLNGKLQLDYAASDKWGLGTRINFASNQNRIDTLSRQEVGKTPGYGTLDVYGNYEINNTLSVRLGVDNVLDKTYAEHASRSNLLDPIAIKVNEPGRTIWAKVTAEF